MQVFKHSFQKRFVAFSLTTHVRIFRKTGPLTFFRVEKRFNNF